MPPGGSGSQKSGWTILGIIPYIHSVRCPVEPSSVGMGPSVKCTVWIPTHGKFCQRLPRPRSCHGSVFKASRLYMIGDKDRMEEVDVLDFVSREWSTVANMADGGVRQPNVVVVGDCIIVVGQWSKKAYKYHIAQDSWCRIQDVPRDVTSDIFSTVATEDKVLVVGKDLREYTVSTDTWAVLTPPPKWHFYQAAILYPGCMLVIGSQGGWIDNDSTMLKYDIVSNTWTVQDSYLPNHAIAVDYYAMFLFPMFNISDV